MPIHTYLKFLKSVTELDMPISRTGKLMMVEILKRSDEGPYRPQDIIALKEIAPQEALNKTLKELIEDGYVKIEADRADRRVKYVEITKMTTSLINKID